MDLTRIVNIINGLPQKYKIGILSFVDFDRKSPQVVLNEILTATMASVKNAHHKEIVQIYMDTPIADTVIVETFSGFANKVAPMHFTDDQIEFIRTRVYRNLSGEFRIIPTQTNSSTDNMSIDGLTCDDDILSARLSSSRKLENGTIEKFDGLRELKKQHYEHPYDGIYKLLAPNLQRIKIISSFEKDDPVGFFQRDDKMYRNVCHSITTVDQKYVTPISLRRAMLLMYLVSGGTFESWTQLYSILHFMVRVPNSNTGYICYLNDFDAGGNGKSKFVSILQGMFGDAFTAFEPHQLRFNISLMGKRLVHISEYEDNETSRQLAGLIKSMTGRDQFQYEGKGMNPIIAETYQNFVISSNRYIYFDDAGIKRRLQNFHCSNFMHLLLVKYFKSSRYLDKLFGSNVVGNSNAIMREMSHSLLDYILRDDRIYDINLRPQSFIIGNLKNPVLRVLFGERCNFTNFVRNGQESAQIDLVRICEAKPEQYNYAAGQIVSWFADLNLQPSRDCTTIRCDCSGDNLIERLQQKVHELDNLSAHLKTKTKVFLEECQLNEFNSILLLDEFFGDEMERASVNVSQNQKGVTVV